MTVCVCRNAHAWLESWGGAKQPSELVSSLFENLRARPRLFSNNFKPQIKELSPVLEVALCSFTSSHFPLTSECVRVRVRMHV